MKCLNEYQIEKILHDEKSIKASLWNRHLNSCPSCQNKLTEVKRNLALCDQLNTIYKGSDTL